MIIGTEGWICRVVCFDGGGVERVGKGGVLVCNLF